MSFEAFGKIKRQTLKSSQSFEWQATHAIWKAKKDRDMFYVYILRSQSDPRRIYRGVTRDLQTRLKDHNKGKSVHTNKYKPWRLVFYAAFEDKASAERFEAYLKTASGIAFARKRLLNS